MSATVEQRNALVRVWLRNRKLFNFAALCRVIDYDRGSFSRFLDSENSDRHDLKEEALSRLENALVPYGYIKIN